MTTLRTSPRKLSAAAAVALIGALLMGLFATAASQPKSAKDLGQTRRAAAEQAFTAVRAAYDAGQVSLDEVYTWSVHWLDASAAGASGAAKKRAFAAHAERMDKLRDATKAQIAQGLASSTSALKADYFAAEAAVWTQSSSR